jgi:signal peptidase I
VFVALGIAWDVAYYASPYGAVTVPSALWPAFVMALVPLGLVLPLWAAADAFHYRAAVPRAYWVRRWLAYAAIAAALAAPGLGARALDETWVQYVIPSASMMPNLLVGDHILAIDGYFDRTPPRRGDLAAFRFPRDPSQLYIKRVIGLPGDTVRMNEGTLYLNGAAVPVERTENFFGMPPDCGFGAHPMFLETLPDGVRYRVVRGCGPPVYENTYTFTVPPGHYFMLGDNRDDSSDSRDPNSGVGFVPAENLVARAMFVAFSWGDAPHWWRRLRLRRIARPID